MTTVGVVVGVLEAIVCAGRAVVRRRGPPQRVPARRSSRVGRRLGRWGDVAVHRSARVVPGAVIYRLDDRLFFANHGYVRARVRESMRGAPSPPHDLVVDAEAMTQVDSTGLDASATSARAQRATA